MDEDAILADDEVICGKCGSICMIDGDGYKWFAVCDTCQDEAEGFDGTAWFMERACGAADNLRKRAREEGA